jgi:enoyl-CoA hydratase
MAGDVRVAAESAQFGQPEIDLGIIPGFGGTQRLPRIVGRDRAKKLMMTGERFSADEAYRLGVVDHIAPADQLMLQALNLAAFLAAKAPIALALIKEAVNLGSDGTLQDGLELESQLFGRATATTDRMEGTTAFLEKRTPVWTGRVAQETDALMMGQPGSIPTVEPDEDPSNSELV